MAQRIALDDRRRAADWVCYCGAGMSAFYVGQRVRIVNAKTRRDLIGLCATVTSPLMDCYNKITLDKWIGHQISIDGIGERDAFGHFRFRPSFLEPIIRPDELVAADPDFIESLRPIFDGVSV